MAGPKRVEQDREAFAEPGLRHASIVDDPTEPLVRQHVRYEDRLGVFQRTIAVFVVGQEARVYEGKAGVLHAAVMMVGDGDVRVAGKRELDTGELAVKVQHLGHTAKSV